jgi:pimeloyl-ACP methyl ester carboxylesterase
LFFTPSKESQAAGQAFVKRAAVRVQDRDPESTEVVAKPQAKAIITWCAAPDPGHASLKAIAQPTLIVHGSDDTMFPSGNAYEMFKAMKNAQLAAKGSLPRNDFSQPGVSASLKHTET